MSEANDTPRSPSREPSPPRPPSRQATPRLRLTRARARRQTQAGVAGARRAERALQVEIATLSASVLQDEKRLVPCLPCLNSALAGQSTGECWAKPGVRRCERCDPGGSCRQIPTAALPVALFFLDYVQQDPSRVNATEKNKRRIAVKVVLKGVSDGCFPLSGDPRLA
ncbi:hypothetical protein LRP88_12969 [Fusarium phalaenopsidis]